MDRNAAKKALLALGLALLLALSVLRIAAQAETQPPPKPAGDRPVAAERNVGGVRILAMAAAGARHEISVLSPEDGVRRIAAALALIAEKSPGSARAIRQLEAAGQVTLVYYPNNFRDRTRLNSQTVALFLPDFLERHGLGTAARAFTVVINQFGVKWPAAELAAVIVHELAGHGIQHLQNRIASARLLDLECEASLYQEQAYQDFGVAKKSRTVVLFRRQMEFRYCADFRAYIRDRLPAKLALWEPLNPDVPALLADFAAYRGTQMAQQPGAALTPRSR